eukprot:747359-Hanusia_phi.AAC.1
MKTQTSPHSFTVEELIFAVDCLGVYATRQQITELFKVIDEDECGDLSGFKLTFHPSRNIQQLNMFRRCHHNQ